MSGACGMYHGTACPNAGGRQRHKKLAAQPFFTLPMGRHFVVRLQPSDQSLLRF